MSNILFVDDDIDILEINQKYFSKQGFIVKTVSSPEKVLTILKDFPADCILLDLMMPKINGFELCNQIRAVTDIPILFLTGRNTEKDKVKGLMMGADDYIIKPYSFPELSARIHAQIRRYHSNRSLTNQIHHPPLMLDLTSHKAFYNKVEEIILSNREFELLLLLATNYNQLVTYEDISNRIWGTYSEYDKQSIMVITSRLRKKIHCYENLSNCIESIWSKGYKLNIK